MSAIRGSHTSLVANPDNFNFNFNIRTSLPHTHTERERDRETMLQWHVMLDVARADTTHKIHKFEKVRAALGTPDRLAVMLQINGVT